MLKQHLTHLILEMIGEDALFDNILASSEASNYRKGYNEALQDIREKVPELVEKINNLIEYDKIKK
jgi:hypothetical protein